MKQKAKHIIDQLTQNPRQVFVLDFIGACVTAFITGYVLVKFEFEFGMPRLLVIPMALMASLMAVYSLLCSLFIKKRFGPFLLIIAFFNFLFCAISWWLVYSFSYLITPLGYAHYVLESAVVFLVIYIEIKTYLRLK